MRIVLWKATTLAVIAAGICCACTAQVAATAPSQTELTAKSDPPSAPDATTTHAATTAAKPQLQPTVEEEIEALKSRIDQLENQVREAKAASLADSNDTAAMRAAEKELLAGNGTAPPAGGTMAQAPAPSPAAAPAPRRSTLRLQRKASRSPATGPG